MEEILEISPAYNADKDNKVKRKKRKMEEESREMPLKDEQSNNIEDI